MHFGGFVGFLGIQIKFFYENINRFVPVKTYLNEVKNMGRGWHGTK